MSDYPKWSDVECKPLSREAFRKAWGPPPQRDRTIYLSPHTIADWLEDGLIVEVEGEPGVYRWGRIPE